MSEKRTISVVGMSCTGCEANVEDSLEGIDGVESVDADHEQGTVDVDASASVADGALEEAVHDAGYAVEE
ncbi:MULTISPECIES: heavy-metal-associated domain-containing protein [Salinibaculum]|uniref:heavy-metal-associated domain-containing protein n=1 Tax=Salinibaculum TaxID=2732368 RepID=UPI0030CECFD1